MPSSSFHDRPPEQAAVSREPLERLRKDPAVAGLGRRLVWLAGGVATAIVLVLVNHVMKPAPVRAHALPDPASAKPRPVSQFDLLQPRDQTGQPDMMEAVQRVQTGGPQGLETQSALPQD